MTVPDLRLIHVGESEPLVAQQWEGGRLREEGRLMQGGSAPLARPGVVGGTPPARRGASSDGSPGLDHHEGAGAAEAGPGAAGFEPVAAAVREGTCTAAACAAAGRRLADEGASLTEALTRLHEAFAAVSQEPPFSLTAALCVAWAEAATDHLGRVSCLDPLTGLAAPEHLRARIADVYRAAESWGDSPERTHALLVVRLDPPPRSGHGWGPMVAALTGASVAEAVRSVVAVEETTGHVGHGRLVSLVRHGGDVATARERLRSRLGELRVAVVGLEARALPASEEEACRLLQRASGAVRPSRPDWTP